LFPALHATMPKGARVTFAERKQTQARPQASASKSRRSRSDDAFRRKRAIAPKPKPTGYDTQHGWLTPWKKIPYPVSPAPTLRETAIIEKWKDNQKKIREGPLFVRRVVDPNARVQKYTFGSQIGNTAFNVIPTYTTKYERRYRQRPNFTGKLWRMRASF
jgi:hypothetical protein